MYIKNIELKDFRNYDELKTDFNEKVNIIIGNNAQGKTNLLEAVYMTSVGKSFRTNKDNELVRFGCERAKITANAEKLYLSTSVSMIIGSDSKKFIKKDGVKLRKISELLDNIMVVIFSPEDLKIVKDEPEKRRKFIDRELCLISPNYYDNLTDYKRVLLQRNSYLKEETVKEDILDVWDMQLARHGAVIINLRNRFIEKICGFSGSIHDNITNGKEKLSLIYNPNVRVLPTVKEEEEYFYCEIKNSLRRDMMLRTTTKGPHKDDISFDVNGIDMRSFGSQGQQRTCALSLKLAELNLIKEETGEDAILLLDDVMSELDIERQEYLIKTLKKSQLFITTTDIDKRLMDSFPDAKIIRISSGKIEK